MTPTMTLRSNVHVDFNDEGAMVLDLNTSKVLVLNTMGSEIVRRLLAEHPLDVIVQELSSRHSMDSSQVLADATSFLDGLVREQVLERR